MSNLFIIGNGFDRAHNLETGYEHFRKYLKENDQYFLESFENMYEYSPITWEGKLKDVLWRDLEGNLSSFDEEIMLESCFSLVEDLGLEGGDYGVKDTLDSYWERQYGYIERMNKLVEEWIFQVDVNTRPRAKKLLNNKADLFLSFNYTLVLEQIYNIDSKRVLHIHGSIDKENDRSPVIGHGDKVKINKLIENNKSQSLDEYYEKVSSINDAILNYCKRTFKDVNQHILSNINFFENMKDVDEIFVIGHSLGEVDMPYLDAVKRHVKSDTIWNVYYYLNSEEPIFREKIANLGVDVKYINLKESDDFFK